MEFSLSELNNVLGDIKNLSERKRDFLNFRNISIDSRTLSKNDLFIAIKGKNFDGHSFISEVLNKGVKSVVIKEGRHCLISPKKFLLDDEVYLKDLAHLPFVEITNLLSFYEESSLSNYIKNNGINMNTIVKTDSYSSALSIVEDGMAISILDDSTLSKADYKKVKKTKIMDKDFKYTISAIKKDIVRYECNEFFNYLCEENL